MDDSPSHCEHCELVLVIRNDSYTTRTEHVAYRTKFYPNLSPPTQFDEEPLFSGCLLLVIWYCSLSLSQKNYWLLD